VLGDSAVSSNISVMVFLEFIDAVFS